MPKFRDQKKLYKHGIVKKKIRKIDLLRRIELLETALSRVLNGSEMIDEQLHNSENNSQSS